MDIFFVAEIDSHIAVIDLHESSVISDALLQLEQKLFLFSRKGEKYVRVIHGIGSGVLSEAVHTYLSNHPIVKNWKESERGGSCIVIF